MRRMVERKVFGYPFRECVIRNVSLAYFAGAMMLFSLSASAQSLSPVVLPAAGKYLTGGGYSLSGTLGEPVHTTFQNGNVVLTQGQQQPYILLRLLHLNAFIEGAYLGSGQLQAVLNTNFPMDFPVTSCDSITIELRSDASPYVLMASATAILQTDGSATVQFPAAYSNGTFYIVLRHRNSIETWSKLPVLFNGAEVWFDFATP